LKLDVQLVKPDGAFSNVLYNCTVADVLPWDNEALEALPVKSARTLTKGEKRFMVKQVWGNHQGSLAGTLAGRMLADADLKCLHEYLQWQFQQPQIALAEPGVVKIAAVEGHTSEAGAQCIMELKELMKTKKVVVFPIHGDAPLHWTALVLEMKAVGSGVVDKAYYFDWCKPLIAANRNYARKILRLCTLLRLGSMCTSVAMPAVKNKYEQRAGSNDCGFVVWYCLEVFMKKLRLEGEWLTCPRPEIWRKTLQSLEANLLKEQRDWKQEDEGEKTKKFPLVEVVLPGTKKVGDPLFEKHKLETAVKEGKVKTKAKEFFSCARCRWSGSGAGCDQCNPAKAEEMQADKKKQVAHLMNAVVAWYAQLKEQGVTLEHVPEDKKLEKKDGDLSGGGTICLTADYDFV